MKLQAFSFSVPDARGHKRNSLTVLLQKAKLQRMSFNQKTKANGVRTNNCSLIPFTKQEKANDVKALSTVKCVGEVRGLQNVPCIHAVCGKAYNFI